MRTARRFSGDNTEPPPEGDDMTTKSLIAGGAACLALAVAAPAVAAPRDTPLPAPPQGQALSPELVPGAGLTGVAGAQATIRRIVRGTGLTDSGAARFRIAPGRVSYVDPTRNVVFSSLKLASVRFGQNTATLKGIGLLNHRRVPFTVVAVHNALPGVDVLHIAWSHGASLGGRVVAGSVFIR
jgi:hypothetical protein